MTAILSAFRMAYWPTVLAMAGVLLWLADQFWGAPFEALGMVFLLLFGPTTWMVLVAVAVRVSGRAPNSLLTALTTAAGLWTVAMLWALAQQ